MSSPVASLPRQPSCHHCPVSLLRDGRLVASCARQLHVRYPTPLEIPSSQNARKARGNRADKDQDDDHRMRDQPQDDSDIVAVPGPAWTVAEEGVRLGVELVGKDEELIETCTQ